MPSLNSRQALEKLKRGGIAPVYYLAGEEAFLKREIVSELLERFLPLEARDFNSHSFDGRTASGQEIALACATAPFLADHRFVVVKNAEKLSNRAVQELLPYLDQPAAETCLVLVSQDRKSNVRDLLQAHVLSHGEVVTCWPLFEQDALRWISERFQKLGKQCAPLAAKQLLEATGSSLEDLSQEIEKIALYTGSRKGVTVDDVDQASGRLKTHTVFELRDALMAKNAPRALQLLQKLESDGEEPTRLLNGVIYPWLRELLRAKAAPESEKTAAAPVGRFQAKMAEARREGLERYSLKDLLEALQAALECDQAIKTGRLPGSLALELFVLGLRGAEQGMQLAG